jgi:hypothetical protein
MGVSSFTARRIDDMCVCAESLEVEVTFRYQLVVQWLECSLTMTEDSGSIPEISDHSFQIITFSSLKSNVMT